MHPGSGPWQLTWSARARLIQPRHWQVSWQSGRRPELQRQPCGVLFPRSGPWRTSSGCHQQSRPHTRGSRREPPHLALSPICPQQAWSSWSRGPETPETGRCSARWRSSAGYATYGWAKQLPSGFLTCYAGLCPVLELQDRGGGVHHPASLQVCGRGPCVASSPHGLIGPVVRHAGLAVG